MSTQNRCRVFLATTDAFVFEGTPKECAEFIGVSHTHLLNYVRDGRKYIGGGKYRIVPVDGVWEKELKRDGSDLRAIQAWDAFIEPIREKYGVPVYKGGE